MGIRWRLYSVAGGALAAEAVAYLLWRPRMLRWGATADEASEPLPGDDHTPHPRVQSTRGVTINAPPKQVWPWLMQMGIGRARVLQPRLGGTADVPRPVRRGQVFGDPHSPRVAAIDRRRDGADGSRRVRACLRGRAMPAPGCPGGLRAAAVAAAHPVRRRTRARRGPGSPRGGLLRRRPAAPLHGDRDARRDQGTRGRKVLPCRR